MQHRHKILIAFIAAIMILYIGGWRIIMSESDHEPVIRTIMAHHATAKAGNVYANADYGMYLYSSDQEHFYGLVNIKNGTYANGSMFLALLVIAIPFGIMIF